MNYILTFILVILFKSNAFCQKSNYYYDSCSNILKRVSYFWKLDSLGTNGYRSVVYKELKSCIKGKITLENILNKLGRPNRISKDNLGSVYYGYYFFDGRALPKEADLTKELLYIIFRFDKNNPYLAFVGESHLD